MENEDFPFSKQNKLHFFLILDLARCIHLYVMYREDVRGVAGVAAATPFFQVLLHKLGPKI